MPIQVFIADKSIITVEGLKALIGKHELFQIQQTTLDFSGLKEIVKNENEGVIIFDPVGLGIASETLRLLMLEKPNFKWLAISQLIFPLELKKYLNVGVQGYLLKECDEQEIVEALEALHAGGKYLCGQVAEKLVHLGDQGTATNFKKMNCGGIEVSSREIEIIKFITEGYSNKEIADKLFLSLHTVNTHRKNIMNKLGINNTAGLVMFAIKNEILNPNPFLFS
jgi:DNA-binding NarL/FixJ family response regulator